MTDTGIRVLIVDDEPTQRRLLTAAIERAGHSVETAADGHLALSRLADRHAPPIGCVILDLAMPGLGGLDVLASLRPLYPSLPVIVLTAHSGVSRIVEAMRAGASDFIVKPASAERIRTAIRSAMANVTMTGELPAIRAIEQSHPGFEDLVGNSKALKSAIQMAKKAAITSIPVLIEGPSGVGKELFARAIHEESDRASGPFIAVNCGALPENLVESILFGHEKGSFTGAVDRHIGKFQEASGGTLFLDEVGELPQDIQVKLLRALQEGEVDPIGAERSVPIDVRLISATNRDMAARVAEGAVREDFYYRLNVFPLRIPSLRERLDDIPALADHFAKAIARTENLPEKSLSDDALALVCSYDWPGNIRQLQNSIFRAVVMSDDPILGPADFEQIDPRSPAPSPARPIHEGVQPDSIAPTPTAHQVSLLTDDGNIRPLAEIEADAILSAIKLYDGKLSEVARRLGIGRSTLYRRIEDLDLEQEARRARIS